MTYPDSVQFLYALGNEMKTAKLGLERISAVLAALGNPQRAYRVVHVAGTNGKGSTCAMIAAGLQAAGVRTGLFTSPHLIEPTERIQIDGIPATKTQFSRAFDVVHRAASSLDLDAHPSYFETVAAMAFWLFRELNVQTAVIEVGLGGRLDADQCSRPGADRDNADRPRSSGIFRRNNRADRRRKGGDFEARRAGSIRAATARKLRRCSRRGLRS